SVLRAAGQVRSPLWGRRGALPLRDRALPRRRRTSRLPFRPRELSPARRITPKPGDGFRGYRCRGKPRCIAGLWRAWPVLMEIFRTVSELRGWSRALRRAEKEDGRIGLVPTMGALHQGHASLIHAARARCAHAVVSIFVNPTQFGPNEDYDRYPRSFESDCVLAQAGGADAIFAPSVEEMY